jgi:hypothetical protein
MRRRSLSTPNMGHSGGKESASQDARSRNTIKNREFVANNRAYLGPVHAPALARPAFGGGCPLFESIPRDRILNCLPLPGGYRTMVAIKDAIDVFADWKTPALSGAELVKRRQAKAKRWSDLDENRKSAAGGPMAILSDAEEESSSRSPLEAVDVFSRPETWRLRNIYSCTPPVFGGDSGHCSHMREARSCAARMWRSTTRSMFSAHY